MSGQKGRVFDALHVIVVRRIFSHGGWGRFYNELFPDLYFLPFDLGMRMMI